MKDGLAELKKFCPCGGVILADTEDFKTPLCVECHDQHVRELKKSGVVVYGEPHIGQFWAENKMVSDTHRALLICVEEI